eukprot:scaffold10961_cov56-Phaeocystis_antarctica.AAC.3
MAVYRVSVFECVWWYACRRPCSAVLCTTSAYGFYPTRLRLYCITCSRNKGQRGSRCHARRRTAARASYYTALCKVNRAEQP